MFTITTSRGISSLNLLQAPAPAPASAPSLPYSLPSTVNTSVLIGSNSGYDVRPASHSQAQLNIALSAYGGPTLVPTWSAYGACIWTDCGGHSDYNLLGTMGFDFATGAWFYQAPGNGLTESPTDIVEAQTTGVPWVEMAAATGNFPAPPHAYYHNLFVNRGSKGTVGYFGRGAISQGILLTGAVHLGDLATSNWTRGATTQFTRLDHESGAAHDPTTGRYYWLPAINQLNGVTSLQYWDSNTDTIGSTTTFTAFNTPDGAVSSGFVDDARRILFFHNGASRMFAWNLNNIGAGASLLTVTGSLPNSAQGGRWAGPINGKWYFSLRDPSNTLYVFDPGATPFSGSSTCGTQAIGGAGVPNWFGSGSNRHYGGLMAVPALGADILAWVFNWDAANRVALIKV